MNNEHRRFTTSASAHGMNYLPLKPKVFNMTLEEANADVAFWRSFADTVGGDAFVVERPDVNAARSVGEETLVPADR